MSSQKPTKQKTPPKKPNTKQDFGTQAKFSRRIGTCSNMKNSVKNNSNFKIKQKALKIMKHKHDEINNMFYKYPSNSGRADSL